MFEFATATRILFGSGLADQLGVLARDFGLRALLVAGAPESLVQAAQQNLAAAGLSAALFWVRGEPSIQDVADGLQQARQQQAQVVIGLGGGSAIDTAKAIAALLTNPGEVLDYLEVIGGGRTLAHRSAPFIAVPTTAGTGAEVTRNAVLYSPEHRLKVSLRSPLMLAHLAIVDPDLTLGMPPEVTASTGLDALTQVIEPFLSNAANPLTDALCRDGIRWAARSLERAYFHSDDRQARTDMALVSLFGGLALANSRLGAVHGFAGVLGGMYAAPHGVICACLLPHVLTVNARYLQESAGSQALQRFEEVARLLTGQEQASLQEGVDFLLQLTRRLRIPSLSALGVKETDFPRLIEAASKASSMKGNPVRLPPEGLAEILRRAW